MVAATRDEWLVVSGEWLGEAAEVGGRRSEVGAAVGGACAPLSITSGYVVPWAMKSTRAAAPLSLRLRDSGSASTGSARTEWGRPSAPLRASSGRTDSNSLSDSSSKTRMNVSPTILRFRSGSVTPSRTSRKRSLASTWMRFSLRWRWKVSTTRSGSSRRRRPLSTKMQVSWSPIARWTRAAVTGGRGRR